MDTKFSNNIILNQRRFQDIPHGTLTNYRFQTKIHKSIKNIVPKK